MDNPGFFHLEGRQHPLKALPIIAPLLATSVQPPLQDTFHPEVKAILSLANGNARVIEKPGELKTLDFSKQYAVVVQTTFNPEAFLRIVNEIILFTKKTIIYNTLCEETIKRQKESLQLANEVDFIVVVGGKNSSNTKTLYNTVKKKVPAVHIEDINELNIQLFKDIDRVGIISGASAPENEVKKVYDYLTGSAG